tara:strand:- start:11424 stop:12725 length:1302 start_codon:yes stop_codon:yes gene_type:complete
MFRSLQLNIDSIVIIMIISSVIGVAISYGDIYLYHICLFIMLFLLLLRLKLSGYRLNLPNHNGNLHIFFLIIFLWYLSSIFWAPNLLYAFKYLFYLLCGSVLSLSIIFFVNSIQKLDILFKVLTIIFIIELIIALFESFTPFQMPISRYSEWASIFGKTSQKNFANHASSLFFEISPPTGFHWDTNDLAIAMLLILPFFIVSNKISTKIIGISSIITIIAMASSRSVFIGLITILIVYFFAIKKKLTAIIMILGFASIVFLGILQLQTSENPRLNELANSFEIISLYLTGQIDVDNSLQWRFELAKNGIDALIKSKGLGVGAGGSVAIQEQIGGVAGRFTSMHNFWIEILVEGGIIFFIFFSTWYIAIIINLYKIARNIKNKLSNRSSALFLSMVGFIPAALAASSTVYFFPMWIMLGMSIGMINLNNSLNHN